MPTQEITTLQIASDASFSELVLNETTEGTTSKQISTSTLPYGKLYSRVKHVHDATGPGEWSGTVKFIVPTPEHIIGVCLDQTTPTHRWYWIDIAGNQIDHFDRSKHATFDMTALSILDLGRAPVTMTKIPKFFVKTSTTGISKSFSQGKKCWWISSKPHDGFRIHPAFKRSTNPNTINDCIYFSTYAGHSETFSGTTLLGSKLKQNPLVGSYNTTPSKLAIIPGLTARDTYLTHVESRNNPEQGVAGFHIPDCYDFAAVRLLALIANANSDMQEVGGNNTSTYPITGSTSCKLVLKGTQENPVVFIDDLWDCYEYQVDGVEAYLSGSWYKYRIRDVDGNMIPLSADVPDVGGYVSDIHDEEFVLLGDTHDAMELFLPKEISPSDTVSFRDGFSTHNVSKTNPIRYFMYCGGASYNIPTRPVTSAYAPGSHLAGIFWSRLYDGSYYDHTACRIVKY